MAATQAKFSENVNWKHSMIAPREDMETIPFVGIVAGELPAVNNQPEVRRRDVGQQVYGGKVPKIEGVGKAQDLGFLPTADAILFLKHQYVGSRAPTEPQRYFPLSWR